LKIASDFAFDNRERPLEQLQQIALENRSDLRILTILEKQAFAESELAKAEGKPDLTAFARYTRSLSRFDQFGLSEGGAVVPLQDADNILSFGVSIPLFTRQRSQGAVDAALSRANQVRLQREHLQQAISQEVEAAYRRWAGTCRALEILQTGVVQQSEKSLTVIREAYRLGQLRVMDVLNEQRRLVETELAYVDSQAEAALASAELERAVGGNLP
jgi:cobalt-zinc-cadmium efflux system outer membrane protein